MAFGRGWDDLFNKCSENLNSLTQMKLSPYYKGVWQCAIFLCFVLTIHPQYSRKRRVLGRRN